MSKDGLKISIKTCDDGLYRAESNLCDGLFDVGKGKTPEIAALSAMSMVFYKVMKQPKWVTEQDIDTKKSPYFELDGKPAFFNLDT